MGEAIHSTGARAWKKFFGRLVFRRTLPRTKQNKSFAEWNLRAEKERGCPLSKVKTAPVLEFDTKRSPVEASLVCEEQPQGLLDLS